MGKGVLWMGKIFLAVVLPGIFLLSGPAFCAEFSADMHMITPGGEFDGKIYVKGDMQRQEGTRMGEKFVTIIRLDKGVLWNLMTGQKMYMESVIPENSQNDPNMQENVKDMAEIKKLGEETVNGYKCEKYEYVFHDKSKGTMTQWIAKDLGYPVKMVHSGGIVIEYENIKTGNIADSFFEIPAGYQKFQMPGMPGGMKFPR